MNGSERKYIVGEAKSKFDYRLDEIEILQTVKICTCLTNGTAIS